MKKLLLAVALCVATFTAIAKPLVVYSGRSEALVGPLFEQFQKDTGIELDVRYNSSPALATQLLNEREATPADVVFFQESSFLSVLAEANLLKQLPASITNQVPERFMDRNKQWVGTSARSRVLAYNTDKIKPEDLPKTLEEFADPKWAGKIGWAPTNASFQAHISALRKQWGEEKTEAWLKAMKANKPATYPKNAVIVSAVGQDEIQVGWVNHYYLHNLKKQNPNLKVANYSFPEDKDIGNMLMIVGAGIVNTTLQPKEAEMLVNYLLEEPAQQYFAEEVFEYPTRPGVATAEGVPSVDSVAFVEIDQGDLADLGPTMTLLKKYGLL